MPPRTQSRDPHNDIGAFLGQQLREVRTDAGYQSQDAFAPVLNRDRSVIGKAESGEYPPTEQVLKDWLDACGVAGRLRLVLEGMARVARVRQDPVRQQTVPWFEREAQAHTLRYWAPVLVPGLFQTDDYARALYIARGHEPETVAELVAARMKRQEILSRPQPPDVTVVLWEPVLHHMIGSPEVMREQLARLVELSRRILIHILPGRVGANAGLGGAINLATADDTPELLLSDGLIEDSLTSEPALIRRASATFNGVRGDALARVESRAMISEAIEAWN
jgi:DNA-binding XRE family transcriptional regulator